MNLKCKFLYFITIFSLCSIPQNLFAGLTTMQHWDPSPRFSANDSMIPPNSQLSDLVQAKLKNEKPNKKRAFGLNFSGFVQGSVRAKGYTGSTDYGTVTGSPQNGFEMGDFRGTMYAMGLFLGANPENGKTIYDTTVCTGLSTIPATCVTTTSITNFDLPECLENIALELSGHGVNTSPLIFSSANPAPAAADSISIFDPSYLARDTIYFGAFSMPINYKKQGFRFEFNLDLFECIGITIQSGFANMKQTFISEVTGVAGGQTNLGPYSLSKTGFTTGSTTAGASPLYFLLNQSAATTGNPNTTAQTLFDANICNNLGDIIKPGCGANQTICSFDDYSVEDVRIMATVKHSFGPNRSIADEDGGSDDWPDMIFTPYFWVGGSCPTGAKINYTNLLSLPFGNNGHASVGGAGGMTFDFAESVEIGFEGGVTYFMSKEETRPFPTHQLQRILYPFTATVCTQPGMNWHARALLSAYQFMPHVNFWFTYEFIEHKQDKYTIKDSSVSQYYVPSVLECRSDWRAQFFNAALSFDIQPGLQASIVWQQPISPRNAYYPVTVLGSINFMF